ncbi:MAG: hypothetical protein JXQ87_19705 [Bacteroidia bacterium]
MSLINEGRDSILIDDVYNYYEFNDQSNSLTYYSVIQKPIQRRNSAHIIDGLSALNLKILGEKDSTLFYVRKNQYIRDNINSNEQYHLILFTKGDSLSLECVGNNCIASSLRVPKDS